MALVLLVEVFLDGMGDFGSREMEEDDDFFFGITLESPKSQIFKVQSSLSSMFAGFKSR